MSRLFLNQKHLGMLQSVFNSYCPESEVLAYGSRVNGDAHDGSDIDMAIRNFDEKTFSITTLKQLLNDSNVPFLMDIVVFDTIPASFRTEIEKNYVIIFPELQSGVELLD